MLPPSLTGLSSDMEDVLKLFPPWGWSHTIEFKQSCLRDIFWGGCCLLLTDKYLGLSLLADKPKSTLKEVPSEGYG